MASETQTPGNMPFQRNLPWGKKYVEATTTKHAVICLFLNKCLLLTHCGLVMAYVRLGQYWFSRDQSKYAPSQCNDGSHWLGAYQNWSLIQAMACCLTAPSHYLNQCWLIISQVLWHSPEDNLIGIARDIYPWYQLKITDRRLQLHLPGANVLKSCLLRLQ